MRVIMLHCVSGFLLFLVINVSLVKASLWNLFSTRYVQVLLCDECKQGSRSVYLFHVLKH
jgi:hypothetical protein